MNIEKFENIITEIDKKDAYSSYNSELPDKRNELESLIQIHFPSTMKAVLGIDIYEYSKYAHNQQVLLPPLFGLMIKETIRWCIEEETATFSDFAFEDKHIDTGDGGFLVFDNPFQALLFNIKFHILLRTYNTGHFYPALRSFVGDLVLRTCLTFDLVNDFNSNKYGPG